jgi:hypothetical protein
MHWGVVGNVKGGPSVAAAPGRQSPRGGKLSISDEKEIRFSAPLTNSELFIKMKGNSINDRDHFEVYKSSRRGGHGHCDHRTSGFKQSLAKPLLVPVTASVLSDMTKNNSLCISFYTRGAQFIKKFGNHLKILCALRITLSKFLTDDPQIIKCHSTKFGDLIDLANEIYTPLLYKLILSCIRNQKTGGGDT